MFLLAAALPAVSATLTDPQQVISRAPYVQLSTPTSIWVVWRTDQRIEPVVRFGRDLVNLTERVLGTNIVLRVALGTNKNELKTLTNRWPELVKTPKLHSAPAGTYQYEAFLSGLAPDTQYYYAVCDGEIPLTDRDTSYHFRTHPFAGTSRPLRFWSHGDSGTARDKQRAVYEEMLNFTARDQRPIDCLLHLGDMAYNRGRDVEFSTRFFAPYEAALRHTVCWPSFANHEGITSKGGTNCVGPYFDAYVCPTNGEAGGVPSGNEGFYSFDYGRVHIISLNSHDVDRRPTGIMAKWLKRDLAYCQGKADWLICYFHHCPYSKGSHDTDREKQLIEMRRYIMPILETGGVDLVLAGHSHIYERSMLMDGAYATPTVSENVILDDGDGDPKGDGPYRKPPGLIPNAGTVQLVVGCGGTTIRRKATMPVMHKTILDWGSVVIDIDGDTLLGRMVDLYGDVRDTFSIVKRGPVTPMRLAYPALPQPWHAPKGGEGTDEIGTHRPEDFVEVIAQNAEWQYLAGAHPEGDAWTKTGFEAKGWMAGPAPFGYSEGSQDFRTPLPDMKGQYSVVYIRHEFDIEQADQISDIALMINYDDGFIAYLNGKEVVRKGVGKDHGKKASDIKSRKAEDRGKHAYLPIGEPEKKLKNGRNVLAIEGHNARLESSSFVLDPYLIMED
jgi:hypothetical protein